jgi:hypothetical protein
MLSPISSGAVETLRAGGILSGFCGTSATPAQRLSPTPRRRERSTPMLCAVAAYCIQPDPWLPQVRIYSGTTDTISAGSSPKRGENGTITLPDLDWQIGVYGSVLSRRARVARR